MIQVSMKLLVVEFAKYQPIKSWSPNLSQLNEGYEILIPNPIMSFRITSGAQIK